MSDLALFIAFAIGLIFRMDRKRIKTLKTQASMIYPGLFEAVDDFLASRTREQSRIRLATLYAEVLATEYFVCVKSSLGFVKYLN